MTISSVATMSFLQGTWHALPGPYGELWWTGQHCLVANTGDGLFLGPTIMPLIQMEIQVDACCFCCRNLVFKSAQGLDHSHMLQFFQNSILIITSKKVVVLKALRTFDAVRLFFNDYYNMIYWYLLQHFYAVDHDHFQVFLKISEVQLQDLVELSKNHLWIFVYWYGGSINGGYPSHHLF